MVADILRQYREWRKTLLDVFDRSGNSADFIASVDRGASELKSIIRDLSREYGKEIASATHRYNERQFEYLDSVGGIVPDDVPQPDDKYIEGMVLSLVASVDVVRSNLSTTALSLRDETESVGSRLLSVGLFDNKASSWRHGGNLLVTKSILEIWGSSNSISGDIIKRSADITGEEYKRQAIAAIDGRTTACCLAVHGQIVGFDKPFRLSAEPRFAEYVYAPPFHWNCRTAISLYTPEMDDSGVTTDDMRSAALAERKARRETGKRVEIHPAHATSRR
jgi:hypothetical protein